MAAVSDADYKPCPHCGRELHKWTRSKHIAACPQRPEIAQRMREALAGADGYAATPDEYAARAAQMGGLPGRTAVLKHFGAWGAVIAHFGVQPASRDDAYRRRSETRRRTIEQRRNASDPLLVGSVRVRTDYGDGDGLAYYGERQLAGGGTVYMLR